MKSMGGYLGRGPNIAVIPRSMLSADGILQMNQKLTPLSRDHLKLSPALHEIAEKVRVTNTPFRIPDTVLEGFFRGLTRDTQIDGGKRMFGSAVDEMNGILNENKVVSVKINSLSRHGIKNYFLEFTACLGPGQYRDMAVVDISELVDAQKSES